MTEVVSEAKDIISQAHVSVIADVQPLALCEYLC